MLHPGESPLAWGKYRGQLDPLHRKPGGKYGARKTVYHGKTFDSESECERYKELALLKAGGKIKNLKVHVRMPLLIKALVGTGFTKVGDYIADFVYDDLEAMRVVHEDHKGVKTPVYQLKKRLIKALYGITILETRAKRRRT